MNKKRGINLFIIIIAIIAIVAITITIITNVSNQKYRVKIETIELSDVKYFLLEQDNKYGVIDSSGNVVIEPKYYNVQIPDPRKDVFITYESETSNGKATDSKNSTLFESYDNVEAIEISQLSSLVPYEKTALKYKQNNLYGLISIQGKQITEPIYEEILSIDYKEGYLKVKKDGAYGVINVNGVELINTEYDNVTTDGYYDEESLYENAGFILKTKTDEGYRYGYANKNGKIILENTYNSLERLNEKNDKNNVYLISSVNGKYGLIKNNKQILENEYVSIEYDRESELLVVDKGTAKGIADLTGKMIVPVDYDNILIGGEYINAYKEEQRLVFDHKGSQIETTYTNYVKTDNDYAIVIDENNNYNIVDKNNNKMLNAEYVYIEYFTNDLYIATQGNKTGLINSSGRTIIPMQYSTMQKIDDIDLLQAKSKETGRIDLIDAKGNVITGIENATMEKTEDCLIMSSENDRAYFDFEGKKITYKTINPNNKLYASSRDGKWGFVDSNNNLVVDYKYDFVTEFSNGFAGFKINGLWGVINDEGKVVLSEKYEISSNETKFLSTYYEVSNGIGVPMYSGDVQQTY